MSGLAFRLAAPDDRPRILEIAAQIWEGDDYIPDVIDDWLAPGPAKLVVATVDGQLAAFARYDLTFPGYAWFEGLRTDPAYQNRGLGKALTGHLVERAAADGVDRIGLSIYMDNIASQKVTAAFGFGKVASFAHCTRNTPVDAGAAPEAAPTHAGVVEAPVAEAAAFIAGSAALRAGHGFLPHSWRFYPFARSPERALAQMTRVLGVRHATGLAALMCIGDQTPHGPASFSIDFLEGDREAMLLLARHALSLANTVKYVESMVACDEGSAGCALNVLREVGFNAWNNGVGDVFVYERPVP